MIPVRKKEKSKSNFSNKTRIFSGAWNKVKSSRISKNFQTFFGASVLRKSSRICRKIGSFFCSMERNRSQVGFQRIFDLFSGAWSETKSSRISKNFQFFSGAWCKAKSSRKSIKNRKICEKNYEASHSVAGSEICPHLAGNGSVCDYAMRTASGWRWAQPVRRDTGECVQAKPACAAGSLCFIPRLPARYR